MDYTEGQIPKGALYIGEQALVQDGLKHTDTYYAVPTTEEEDMSQQSPTSPSEKKPLKYDGIGPTDDGGMPLSFRMNVDEKNQHQWYKQMYKSLHTSKKKEVKRRRTLPESNSYRPTYEFPEVKTEPKPKEDTKKPVVEETVTKENPYKPAYELPSTHREDSSKFRVSEKNKQNGRLSSSQTEKITKTDFNQRKELFTGKKDADAGYRSEPENSSTTKSRSKSLSDFKADFKSSTKPKTFEWNPPNARSTVEKYRCQPRSIVDYEPGFSSLAFQEAKTGPGRYRSYSENSPTERKKKTDSTKVHTRMADEHVCIGPAPTSKSYLNMEEILKAVKDTGAQAVHPGYGFLSENTIFAARLNEIGVEFIGPSSGPIKAMGDKIESKRIATKAGVNMIPGHDGVVEDVDSCIKYANEIGYPVMVKASAGGGGKGMRIAWNDKECKDAYRLSKNEAASSFGDDRMLIEKRNQKVIEEAPSTFVDPDMRRAMGEQATTLAKAVGYDSAGTVEFLVDSKKNFYFLEMNTRLQVEHPITESITGIDIVNQMIRVSSGNKLLHTQTDIPIDGWAFECRVYAEDPYKNFGMPSIGRLYKYIEPNHIDRVRCDSGIQEGSEISIYYDPMICKLVTYGENRQAALDTMVTALDSYVIRGVTHNIPLLRDIVTEKRFVAGDISTNYLPSVYPDGFPGKVLSADENNDLCAIAVAIYIKDQLVARTFTNQTRIPMDTNAPTEWALVVNQPGGESVSVKATLTDGQINMDIGGRTISISSDINFTTPLIETDINGNHRIFQLSQRIGGGKYNLRFFGTVFPVSVMDEFTSKMLEYLPERAEADISTLISAPMPGMLKSVTAIVGESVAEGQEVCVLEAMKMQNSLVAAKTGKIKAVNFKEGQTVDEGDVIVELE
ncbi:propionyl-CoA carboxylase alpha chain [Mytilus galloprovincialis]|uniref:Propionyl-CoA carboxylase alpha chain, mitochondrial n=1 Tax=Mytilus galloprovincialis TaxID=29158 RepID=A0A8B6EJ73_MYTGA|nr:propionyl-CoA carboxylase alpha chain [Mytilus galloprovincialis]